MRSDDYRYMQIVDAMASINQRVNLIGVVVESSLPKNTKGTDYFCSVKMIDESRPSFGIYINFFAETMEMLPFVESVGDIIVVSHVVIKTRGSEVYALYNKKFSSFALFEGRDYCKEFAPYQYSSRYKARENDKKFITGLRKWLVHHKIEGLSESLSLREIKEGERFNLLCKILRVCEDEHQDWMLFVWDGTDTPPAPIEAKLEDEMKNPLPLHMEQNPLSRDVLCTFPSVGTVLRMIVDQNPLSRDVLCTFPSVGTVLRMIVDRGNEKRGINYIKTNRWVKFVNVKFEVRNALWVGVLMPFSKLCYLPDDDERVTERQRSYNERVPSKWGRMPFTSFPWPSHLTETDHPDVPFVTLMNVLTHPEVTCKFKCVVRAVAVFPWKVEDFRSPNGVYRVRLTLEDPTARIHAFLYAEDGMKFFGNIHSTDVLTKKRDMLLGLVEGSTKRNPPWIQCCLRSYYIDKSDVWESRNYRVFATKFVG